VAKAKSQSANTAGKCYLRYCSIILSFTVHLRDDKAANPDTFPNITWEYEEKTGTTGLRYHIKKFHEDIYEDICKRNNIEPNPNLTKAVAVAVADSGANAPPSEPFNSETLLRYIRNFVIADDQVSASSMFVN
jgi:hypothetical protein